MVEFHLFKNESIKFLIDSGYYGVDKAVASLLESFTLSGNDKGKSVIMRCPYTGAFTENEILALMTELCGGLLVFAQGTNRVKKR